MRLISSTEVNEVSGAMIGGGVDGHGNPLYLAGETPTGTENWVVRFDAGGSWLDTGYSCVSLNPTATESGSWSDSFIAMVTEIRNAVMDYGHDSCSVNATSSPPFIEISCTLLGKK